MKIYQIIFLDKLGNLEEVCKTLWSSEKKATEYAKFICRNNHDFEIREVELMEEYK